MKKTLSILLSAVLLSALFMCSPVCADAKGDSGKRLVEIRQSAGPSTHYVYDESGNRITEYQAMDPTTVYYGSFSYDKSGNISEKVTEYYNSMTNSWRSQQKETYSYNNAGLLASITFSYYNDTTKAWEPADAEKEIYTYDPSGKLLVRTKGTTDSWTYEYDIDGHLIKETAAGQDSPVIVEYNYVGDQLMWSKRGTTRASYEYAGNTVTQYYETNETPDNDNTWVREKKDVTEKNGLSETCISYEYVSDQWVPKTKNERTYNADGIAISIIMSKYWQDQWKYFEKLENTYDNAGDLLEEARYSYSEGNWNKLEYRTYLYESIIAILDGEDQTVFADGSQTITFRSEAPLSEFQSLLVDGKPCASENYDISSGSTIVTLHADYLETLSEGRHVLSIISLNGIATVDFYTSSVPVTGDPEPVYVFFGIFLMSTLGVAMMLKRRA